MTNEQKNNIIEKVGAGMELLAIGALVTSMVIGGKGANDVRTLSSEINKSGYEVMETQTFKDWYSTESNKVALDVVNGFVSAKIGKQKMENLSQPTEFVKHINEMNYTDEEQELFAKLSNLNNERNDVVEKTMSGILLSSAGALGLSGAGSYLTKNTFDDEKSF